MTNILLAIIIGLLFYIAVCAYVINENLRILITKTMKDN